MRRNKMEEEHAYLTCIYSNGMGDITEVTYRCKQGLLTADEVLQAMLEAMAGFSFMQKSIYDAVLTQAADIELYLKSKND